MLLRLWSVGTGRNRRGEIRRKLRSKYRGAGGGYEVSCVEHGDNRIFQACFAQKALVHEVGNGVVARLRKSNERLVVSFTLEFASIPDNDNGVPKLASFYNLRDRENATVYRIHDLL